jgi:hypothetical protein
MATKGTVGQLLVEMRADLGKLRVDVKEMEGIFKSSFTNIQASATNFAKSLAGSLGIGLGISSIVAFGKSIIDLGGQLKDLSQQTGISAQTLSGLKSTLEENGTSLDAFAKGIFTLQKNLGGIKNESDPAAQAVKALGLNLDELRKADTETFLQLVTDALGKVENPINRAALGAQLLGKNFRELGPAINEMAGRLAELRKGGLSPEDSNRLDEFGDSLTRLNNRIKLLAAEGLATLIRDLSNINFLFSQMFNKSAAVGAILGGAQGIAEGARRTEPFKPPVDTAAVKKLTDQVDSFIAGLQKQADALRVNITEMGGGGQAAKALGLDLEFAAFKAKLLADNLKIPPDAEKRFDQLKATILGLNIELAKTKTILERIAIDEADAAEGRAAQEKAGLAPFKAQDENTIRRTAEAAAMLQRDQDDAADATRAWGEEAIKAMKIADDLTIAFQAIDKEAALMGSGFDATSAKIAALREALRTLTSGPEFEEAKTQLRELLNIQAAERVGEEIGNSLTQGLKNTLLGIETGQQTLGEGMKNLVRNMLLELQGVIFDKTILAPLKAIASGFITGLVGALDTAANDQLKKWAEGLGKSVSSWLGQGLSSIIGLFGGGGGGGTTFTMGGSFPAAPLTRERGGMLPSFAGGGLFIGHGGEFVMQKKAVDSIGADTLAMANRSGKLPDAAPNIKVTINGDIIPREPTMKKEDVIQIGLSQLDNRGIWMQSLEQRMSPRR